MWGCHQLKHRTGKIAVSFKMSTRSLKFANRASGDSAQWLKQRILRV